MPYPYISAKLLCKHLHIILFVCLLLPAATDAAGLGKLKVRSYLGETLDADIELVETSADELASITARVANNDEYIAAGLQDSVIPTGIKVVAQQRADGMRILHLTSSAPINEPFLELLISVNSETLHLVRQYTMLLDPPLSKLGDDGNPLPSSADKSAIASRTYETLNLSGASGTLMKDASSSHSTRSARARRSSAQTTLGVDKIAGDSQVLEQPAENQVKPKHHLHSPEPQVQDDPSESKSAASGDANTYLTQKGDVFGKVAQQYQPAGISLKKVMAAFYKANPDAFLDGDVNQLKVGQVLRIPEIGGAQLTRMGDVHAIEDKKEDKKSLAKAAANISSKATNANAGYVLKISPGDTNSQSDEQDNNQARINQAAPNLQNATSQSATSVVQPPAAVNSPSVNPLVPSANSELSPPAVTVPAPAPQAPAIAAAPHATTPAPVIALPPPSFTENLISNFLWILIGMLIPVVIFLLIYGLNLRHKAKMRRLQEGVFGSIEDAESNTEHADTIPDRDTDALAKDADNTATDALPQERHPNEHTIINIDEIDPLVEAEIYISYGRDEQAESILTHALEATPNRHELSYRLLVIYAGRQDIPSFERYAKTVKEAADRGAEEDVAIWAKVVLLGSQLDAENPLYHIENTQSGIAADEPLFPISPASAQTDVPAEKTIDSFSKTPIAPVETLQFPPLELKVPAAKRFEPLSPVDTPQPIHQENVVEATLPAEKEQLLEFTLPEKDSDKTGTKK